MDVFSTQYLNRVVETMKRVPSFFLSTFFTSVETFDTEEVFFDTKTSRPRISPFVHPLLQGKVVADAGYATKSFKPAYVKDKRVFVPTKGIKRLAGESIGGALSPEQRMAALVASESQDQMEMLSRRFEVMAAEAVLTGKQTIKGDGFDAVVNFGRDASLTFTLAGGELWSAVDANGYGTADINKQLEDWAGLIEGFGGSAEMLVMDAKAWALFRKNKWVRDGLDTTRKGNEATSLIVSPQVLLDGGASYKGTIGQWQVYVYNAAYLDPITGATVKLLADNTVCMVGRALEGVRMFGAIQDMDNLRATEMFSKSWMEQDPSVRYLMLQSAPLMVPFRVNSAVTATVA